ncbi:MAG TPA: glycosyltransferase family 2 protein [Sedimentisphaerales bacterium]|jgi:GT2 family glycosyltransferase|nr:glycosyltransferase family 2 protein [Sedimentisphaerales bacterium]HNU29079.1 glycosyltransferase family 2 protein [Sedimentisphaerales bacterium]
MVGARVSISIVNYNAKEYLEQCLQSLFATGCRFPIEVIVVDNHSQDGSGQLVKEQFPTVTLIQSDNNEGFIKANNRGLRASRGEYVLSLNNDTVVRPGALDALVDFMDSHPESGACGPKVLNPNGSLQKQCRRGFPTPMSAIYYFLRLHKLFPRNKRFGHYVMSHLHPDEMGEIDSLSGACMMVRREVMDRVGLMDESYTMYGDDLDWCYRIKKAGWKIHYVPQAVIMHHGGLGGSRVLPYKNTWEFYRSMAVFHEKHYSESYSFLTNFLVYSGIWAMAGVNIALNLVRREKIVGSRKA